MPNPKFIASLYLLLLWCWAQEATAASFGIRLVASTNQVAVGDTFLYTINVTNISAVTLSNVTITNTLPTAVDFVSATPAGSTPNSNTVVFAIGPLARGQNVTQTITVRANAAGTITDRVSVAATGIPAETTSLVTTVTNRLAGQITVTPIRPSGQVFVGDSARYRLGVTNTGAVTVENIVVSNVFSPGVLFQSLSPSNAGSIFNAKGLLVSVGTLAIGVGREFSFVVQPTNSGFLFVTNYIIFSNADTNSGKPGSSGILVSQPVLGELVATPVSAQTYDPQTGLVKQTIRLENVSARSISSSRVIVAGLSNRLYNAVGTNSGNPFVVYAGTLASGESVDLILEYFIPSRTPGPDPMLTAYAIAPLNPTIPVSSPPNITRLADLGSGRLLIEFESMPGHSYTILYSDNAGFTNALLAQPALVAPADRVQWIDDGPPKTISRLTNGMMRFYRAVETP